VIAAGVAVAWRLAEPPLAPEGVVGVGEAAVRLGHALLARGDLAGLRGVAGDGLLVLLGAAAVLPWADGVVYVGRHPDGAGLLLPTTVRPEVPLDLLARALLARVPAGSAPVVVLHAPDRLVPVGGARPVERERLVAWLARAPGGPS
jgi:hypothetical protein